MHPRELERRLKKLNPRLHIKRYWDKSGFGFNDGVYYGNQRICAIHSGHIYREKHKEHKHWTGIEHRSLEGLFDILYQQGYIKYRNRWKLIN